MKIGTTLEILSVEGKIPVAKDLLINIEIGSEISGFSSFRILTGMLLGPVDLEVEKEPITLAISSGVVGLKKIECGFGVPRNLEK